MNPHPFHLRAARSIGRVGILAAALGVGGLLGAPATAAADPDPASTAGAGPAAAPDRAQRAPQPDDAPPTARPAAANRAAARAATRTVIVPMAGAATTAGNHTGNQIGNQPVGAGTRPVGPAAATGAYADPVSRFLAGVAAFFNNQTPRLNPAQTAQNAAGTVSGKLNAVDPDSPTLSYSVTTGPAQGSVAVSPDGDWTYTPSQSVAATGTSDSFQVTVSDAASGFAIHGLAGLLHLVSFGLLGSRGDSSTSTVTVNVAPFAAQSGTDTAPALSITGAAVVEGNSGSTNLVFTVTLSKASDQPVTVDYTTAGGTAAAAVDFTAATGRLTFTPGTITRQISVPVIGDTTVEPTETFTVTLTNPTGATLATAVATGTITNDDATSGGIQPVTGLPIAAQNKVVAAYFPEWGIYGRNFQVADIPGEELTHVIYSFLNVTPAGEVAIYDSFAATDKRFAAGDTVSGEADQWYYPPEDPRSQQTVWGNFNQLAQLKQKYPHIRVSIAIGGWTLSGNFSSVSSTAAGREKLASSIANFLSTYRMFDGVDFDWEYPGGGGLDGNSASPNDGANYAELLKLVRQKLDVLGQQQGRRYEITVASPAGYDKIANFNLAGLAPYVDFFNLMAYDFHGTWETTTGHQSAFTGDAKGYDVKTAVGLYLKAGVAPNKIVLGAPMYTRGWSGVADGGDGGYLESTSGAAPGTFEAGVYDYKDLLRQVQDPAGGWKLYWDDNAQAVYVYNAAQKLFSSFETPTSIAQKAQWADSLGLRGMMFWDITNDALDSPESLLGAAYSSVVLKEDLSRIRSRSTLRSEVIIGGDGVIAPLPSTGVL